MVLFTYPQEEMREKKYRVFGRIDLFVKESGKKKKLCSAQVFFYSVSLWDTFFLVLAREKNQQTAL